MQHHWPDTDEQPTPLANLTIVEVPLPPDDPADAEQPSPLANLRIEMVPLGWSAVSVSGGGEMAAHGQVSDIARCHDQGQGSTADRL
jgi:hypothetical protein